MAWILPRSIKIITMKRIFLTCLVALSILGVDAQTKKGHKKTKHSHVSRESIAKAEFEKKQAERQQNIEEQRLELLSADSTRRENDRVADENFQKTQVMWKDSMAKMMDSTYSAKFKSMSSEREMWAKNERSRNEINKAAKLSDNQGRQVKNINHTYTEKAKLVKANMTMTDEQKKQELITLNTERMARIKAILGSAKAKKLMKERKEYNLKNGVDMEEGWIDEVEGYAKNS